MICPNFANIVKKFTLYSNKKPSFNVCQNFQRKRLEVSNFIRYFLSVCKIPLINFDFTKILLLSEIYQRPIGNPLETYQRPIRDRHAWSENHRRPIKDLSETHRRPTCLIGDLNMLHQRPIYNQHVPLETNMPGRQPIGDWHACLKLTCLSETDMPD